MQRGQEITRANNCAFIHDFHWTTPEGQSGSIRVYVSSHQTVTLTTGSSITFTIDAAQSPYEPLVANAGPSSVTIGISPPPKQLFTGCTATAGASGIDVTWPDQRSSGYTVTSSPGSVTRKPGTGTKASFAYTDLQSDTSYTFTVEGADSPAKTCTTSAARTLPGPPTAIFDGYGCG